MEVKGATFLYTLAAVMITFAGFSALLLGIRQAAGARLSLLDRYLAKTVIIQLFALTGGALLPPLLGLYDVSGACEPAAGAHTFVAPDPGTFR